jgi:predicted nucleotidyltransferase
MIHLSQDIEGKLASVCKEHRVRHLFLFGSALRSDFDVHASDLDFVVDFSPEIQVLDFSRNYFSFQFALEALFNRHIDLICSNELKNPVLIDEIEHSKVQWYAA